MYTAKGRLDTNAMLKQYSPLVRRLAHQMIAKLPANVETLVLTVNSFRGQTFDKIKNAFGRVVDGSSGRELARFDISDSGPHTGFIIASVSRAGGEWTFKALGERTTGRTVEDLAAKAAGLI